MIIDRVSDVLILLGAGFSVGSGRCPAANHCLTMWLAGAAAVGSLFTAYIRAIGVAAGAKQVRGQTPPPTLDITHIPARAVDT